MPCQCSELVLLYACILRTECLPQQGRFSLHVNCRAMESLIIMTRGSFLHAYYKDGRKIRRVRRDANDDKHPEAQLRQPSRAAPRLVLRASAEHGVPGEIQGHEAASDQVRLMIDQRLAIDDHRDEAGKDCEQHNRQPQLRGKGQEGPLEMVDEAIGQGLPGRNQVHPVLVADRGHKVRRESVGGGERGEESMEVRR